MSGPGPGEARDPDEGNPKVEAAVTEPTSPKESCGSGAVSRMNSEDWIPGALRMSLKSTDQAEGVDGRRESRRRTWSDSTAGLVAEKQPSPPAAAAAAPIGLQRLVITSHLEQLGSFVQHWQSEHLHLLRSASGAEFDEALATMGIDIEVPDERLDHTNRLGADGDGAAACNELARKLEFHEAEAVKTAKPSLPALEDIRHGHVAKTQSGPTISNPTRQQSPQASEQPGTPPPGPRPSLDSAPQGIIGPPRDVLKSDTSARFSTASFLGKGDADVRAAKEMSEKRNGISRSPARIFSSVFSSVPSVGSNWRHRTCPSFDTFIKAVERDRKFEFLSFGIIGANAISLTMSTELAATYQPPSTACVVIEDICFWFYIIELLIRVCARGVGYFYAGQVGWQWFDMLLVICAVQEKMFENSGMNLSYVRIVRLLKVLKVLRIIRLLRFFKELRLILGAMASSLKSIMWACSMVASVTFMFSICFVQGMTGFPQEESPHMPGWSTVAEGMLTLFMAGTGGVDWWGAILPLFMAGWLYVGVFIFYIVFFFFVIQNTITSLFVECLLDRQNNDEALIIQERLERKNDYMAKIQQLFGHMDFEGKGSVTYEQLNDNINHPTMISFSTSLEMEEADLRMFFTILTGSGKQRVDLETFVVGCIKLRGNAKSIDLVDLMLKLKRVVAQQEKQATQIENHWSQCIHELRVLRSVIMPTSATGHTHGVAARRSREL